MATLSWITVVVMVIVALIHNPTTNAKGKPKPPKQQTIIRNCDEIPKKSRSGIYTIYPYKCCPQYAVQVYCDMDTDGGGWTVIQRREDVKLPSGERQDFYLTWMHYVLGFGFLSKEFWLGLDTIHSLTAQTSYTIRFDLGGWENNTAWAKYNFFYVHDQSLNYKMEVEGYDDSGTAGDALSLQNGMEFTTKDNDNDIWDGNCADRWIGAWWFWKCTYSNLNGVYYNGSDIEKGIIWKQWLGYFYSLKKTEMKIRPAY